VLTDVDPAEIDMPHESSAAVGVTSIPAHLPRFPNSRSAFARQRLKYIG